MYLRAEETIPIQQKSISKAERGISMTIFEMISLLRIQSVKNEFAKECLKYFERDYYKLMWHKKYKDFAYNYLKSALEACKNFGAVENTNRGIKA